MKQIHCTIAIVAAAAIAAPGPVAAEAECREIAPKETNAAIDEWLQDHYVCIDPAVRKKNRLLVFLPGTRAMPQRYSLFIQEAARSGLHAVGLRYGNAFAINYEVCPYLNDRDCHEKVRQEILYGNGAFEPLDITFANSAVGRLTSLLQTLDQRYPDEGWGGYLDAGDQLVWPAIVVSGQSQGGGHATMLARDQRVARLINFAWSDRVNGELAPWLSKPFATPPEDLYVFEHLRDRIRFRRPMWKELGLDRLGPEVSVDSAKPPYSGSRTLTTNITPSQPEAMAGPHNSVVVDDFTPLAEDGTPLLRDVWRYLLDVAPAGE